MRRRKVRETGTWVGDVPTRVRRFVLWGIGPGFSDSPLTVNAANDVAEGIARSIDEPWAQQADRWAVIVEADENDVDAWVRTNRAARGYAPYFASGRGDDLPAAPGRRVARPRPI
jgi:hypothetical protein